MSLITIASFTPSPPIQLSDGSATVLRGYYSQRFLNSDGTTPVLAGNGVQGFYYEWVCSQDVDGNLVIPPIEIHTTDNGVDVQTSLFTGQLFIDGTPAQIIFGQAQASAGWIIPAAFGSSTTWGDLDVYNQGQALFPSGVYTYLTASQTVALIAQISLQLAQVGVNGIVQLSYAPVNPAAPIVLSANDPTVGNLRGAMTAGYMARAIDEKHFVNSQIQDDGTDIKAETLNYFQVGDFEFVDHGSRLEINDSLSVTKLFAGGGPVETPANQYAGLLNQCGETSAESFLQTTGQTNVYANGPERQTFLGDTQFDNNGTTVRVYDNEQMISQAARNDVPDDTLIFAEEVCWFLDQGSGKLKARIRLDDGTYATWEGVYTPD